MTKKPQFPIKVVEIDTNTERSILTGMLASKEFVDNIYPMIEPEYFNNIFTRKIAVWILEFHNTYNEAALNYIHEIYNANVTKLKDEEAELILNLLEDVFAEYGNNEKVNVEYLSDIALNYFKKREIEIISGSIKNSLRKNRIDDAEEHLLKFKKIGRLSANWVNPFNSEEVDKVFAKKKEDFFKFPGELGQFLGAYERGWLVGITGPFKRGKCVAWNSLITLPTGEQKTIEKIVKDRDKYTISLNDSGKFEKGKIIEYFDNGIKDIYKVSTKLGRESSVTKIHPFLTPKGWKELQHLNIGDIIAVPSNISFFGSTKIEKHKLKLLAYLLADGGLTGSSIIFTKKNKETMNDFKKCVEKIGDETVVVKDDTISVRIKKTEGLHTKTKEWLKSLNVNKPLPKKKVIPDIIFKTTKDNMKVFLSILFTCNGSIYKEKNSINISYSSSSEKMVRQVSHLLLRFGIVGKIKYKEGICRNKKFPHWELTIRNNENVLKFINKIGFQFNKKESEIKYKKVILKNTYKGKNKFDLFYNYDLLLERINLYVGMTDFRCGVNQAIKNKGGISRHTINQMVEKTGDVVLKQMADSDILWDKITKVEYIGKEHTYDLTVQTHHNFISDDMLVHNTFYLQEFAINAILSGLKTVFFSLEMSKNQMLERIYKRLSGFSSERNTNTLLPIFDCAKNQMNACTLKQRRCKIGLLNAGDTEKPLFEQANPKYKPCTACRYNNIQEYEPETWWEIKKLKTYEQNTILPEVKAMEKMYNHLYRVKVYPRFSAGALVITATQANRAAIDAKNVTSKHTAAWLGKLFHMDAGISLNQTPEEKKQGIMRIGEIIHRHKEFHETETCTVLQNLNIGQPIIDSMIM